MGVSIKQIAELAKVSRGTVDRVIHGRYGVDKEVRDRVNQIIKELDYKTNMVAKALKVSQRNLTLGVIVPPENLPFYKDVNNGIRSAAGVYESCGIKIACVAMKQMNETGWLAAVQELEAAGIRGLITLAIDVPAICQQINQFAKIMPVITYNTDFKTSDRLCFVGQQHLAGGQTAGDLMSKCVQKNGTILMLTGLNTMLAHMQRIEGFSSVLRKSCPAVTLLGPFETGDIDHCAYKIIKSLLQQDDQLAGIFVSGGGAVGAGEALKDFGKLQQVAMVCFDLLEETRQHVRDGVVAYTIGQEPFLQGYMPIKLMYEYLVLGIQPTQTYYYTNIDIRSKANIDYDGFRTYTNLI